MESNQSLESKLSDGPEKIRVLVVDDEPDFRRLHKEFFKCFRNYSVDCVEDGSVAMERMASQKYDLVILDLFMPTGGEEVYSWMKKNNRSEKVLCVSSSLSAYSEFLMRENLAFMAKPIYFEVYRRKVEEVMKNGKH